MVTRSAIAAMHFCPPCGNLLQLEAVESGNLRFYCQTCPYVYMLKTSVSSEVPARTQGGRRRAGRAGGVKNADQTDANCPKCTSRRAYFQQLQIRSADEPMTAFYKCVECGFRWRRINWRRPLLFFKERRANALHLSQASLRTYIACHFLPCRSGCFVSLFALKSAAPAVKTL